MIKSIQIILIIFILLILHYKVMAQNDSIQDNSYYFDDGGISESKNLVKINVLSIVNGDLPVYYERIIGKSFSIEVGVGCRIKTQQSINIKNKISGIALPIGIKLGIIL